MLQPDLYLCLYCILQRLLFEELICCGVPAQEDKLQAGYACFSSATMLRRERRAQGKCMPGSEHAVQKALEEGRYGASPGWIDEDQMISLVGKRVAQGIRQAVAAWMAVNEEDIHGVLGISSSAEAVSVVGDMPGVRVREGNAGSHIFLYIRQERSSRE